MTDPIKPSPLTVLIVDDDAKVREAWARLLHGRGFDTVGAATANEALSTVALLADRSRPAPGPVDVVLTDWELGDSTAEKLVAELTAAGIPVVVCSGDYVSMALLRAHGYAALDKPATGDEIVSALYGVIAAGGVVRAIGGAA